MEYTGQMDDALVLLIAARFRLLGEPVRLKLLAALGDEERSVGELVALTHSSQPNISKHLAALAQGGVVRRRKVGVTTLYALADPTISALCDTVCAGLQRRLAEQARVLDDRQLLASHASRTPNAQSERAIP
ncbi:MAG TPA: metalloregulator ArsR/SmtB family transcription factor [Ktedonobacterales bacterium]|nr:metalloregulator ArsR/SmtB family transcription factor [Ktedonobacterales bacterium]